MGTNVSSRLCVVPKTLMLLCIFCVSFVPSIARAQDNPAILSLLTDPLNSNVFDDVAGAVVVEVILDSQWVACWEGGKFRVAPSSGFTGVLVSEEYPPGSLVVGGNVTDGVVFVYTPWDFDGHLKIVRLTYQLMGTSEPCSYITVIAHPEETSPLVASCTLGLVATKRVDPIMVNWDWSTCEFPVPTRETTWGRVKALYRD